jgi:hypothetical protein
MATVVATPDPATGTVLVQVEQTTLRDLFTRVVASSWQNATTGQAWIASGGVSGNYNVNGTQGTHTMTTVNVARHSWTIPQAGLTDHVFFIQVTVPVLALTQPIQESAMARFASVSNYYFAEVSFAPSTDIATLNLRKNVLGVITTLASVVLPQVHAVGATWNIGISACGSTIKAKAWRSTVAEPEWLLSVNDFDLTTGDGVGARSFLVTGNTNASPIMAFDNAYAYISDELSLYRVTPDLVETQVLGSPFSTNAPTAAANSATATLWDPAAPFDVNVFYRLYSDCGSLAVTSNTVLLDADGFGWLRDPSNPSRNIAISLDAFFDPCVDEDVVVFSGLGDPQYASASGVYDIVDAQRPNTVSQTRKNYASSLALTSFSLDDIINLEDLYAPGTILSLTLPTSYGWALRTFGTDWITIGDIQQSYIGRDQELTARGWSMPFRLSPPPPNLGGGNGGNGVGGGGATYDDLAASVIGTTYNTLTASGNTFDQVAAGTGY